MSYIHTEETIKGFTLKVMEDEDTLNPVKEYDLFGNLALSRRCRYDFGHETFSDPDEYLAALRADKAVILPVYMYDHSGITISTSGFRCPWDSGQVGFISVTLAEIQKEFPSWKVITKKRREQIEKMLKSTVRTVDNYLTGNVWGFVIEDPDGEIIESCWGFNGEPEDCESEARDMLNYVIKSTRKKHFEQIKVWIRNQVPLMYRTPCPV